MLGDMHFLGLGQTAFAATVAIFWVIAVVGLSLLECGRDLGTFLATWRFVLFEGPVRLVRDALDGLRTLFLGAERPPARHMTAQDLSEVLQIPLVDAELSLELSEAFLNPTDDPQLNDEAVGLLRAARPRDETWRVQASECCRRLRELSLKR